MEDFEYTENEAMTEAKKIIAKLRATPCPNCKQDSLGSHFAPFLGYTCMPHQAVVKVLATSQYLG
jgi:hypothetical protein